MRGGVCTVHLCRLRTPRTSLISNKCVDAFFAAAHRGDFDALVALFDPDVLLRVDGGETACTIVRSPWSGRRGASCDHVCAARRSQNAWASSMAPPELSS